MSSDLRSALMKLAADVPETRRHLVPLLRDASAHKEAIEFDTESALRKYLRRHPDADKSKHTVKKTESPSTLKDDDKKDKAAPSKDLKGKLTSFFDKVKGAKDTVVKAIQAAPAEVQQMFVDPDHRKKVLSDMSESIVDSSKSLAKKISGAAGKEVHEIKHAVGATKKLFKKPPGPLSKQDKKSLYAAGAYVAGAVIAATPPVGTALAAASALGHSFAVHVGMKAIHSLMDHGFTHYEWAESVFHLVEHVSAENDENAELAEGLARVVADVLKNLTDEDMEKILSGGEMPDED